MTLKKKKKKKTGKESTVTKLGASPLYQPFGIIYGS